MSAPDRPSGPSHPPTSAVPIPLAGSAGPAPSPSPASPVDPADPAADGLVAALRDDLHAAGYTVEGVQELLGEVASAALHREQTVPALRALEGAADPRAILARTFLLGAPADVALLQRALPGLGVSGAVALGLLAREGDRVRGRVDLRPYAAVDAAGEVAWWLASDPGELVTGRALAADHVLGAGGASLTLARATIRSPRRRALDLGTGCGVQALHALRHCTEVVGTDVSRRALRLARLNAGLAGVPRGRLDLRHGSLLEPVRGEEFDLVVSNPPFVITPRMRDGGLPDYEYRDAGMAGDDLVRSLVTGLGEVLAPGGVAQLLGNWEHRRGEDWAERVGGWLDASGLDGWVVQREVQDPAEYAETWIRDGGTTPDRDPAAWAGAYRAWLDDFAARGVEAVGFGVVTLRRPVQGGPTLRRVEEHAGPVSGPLGDALEAGLAAHDWLSARDDDALARERLRCAGDVTEERHHRPGEADPTVILLRQGGGLARLVRASTEVAAFVGACDGELEAGVIVRAMAALWEVPADDVAAAVLPAARSLVRDGLLVPA